MAYCKNKSQPEMLVKKTFLVEILRAKEAKKRKCSFYFYVLLLRIVWLYLDIIPNSFLAADQNSWLALLFVHTSYLRIAPLGAIVPVPLCQSITDHAVCSSVFLSACVCVWVCTYLHIPERMFSWCYSNDYESLNTKHIAKLPLTNRKYVLS